MTTPEQRIIADLHDLAAALKPLADESERQLRAKYPTVAAYAELMIAVRPISGGGFDVLGNLYPTQEAADEARRSAIVLELIKHDRVMACK